MARLWPWHGFGPLWQGSRILSKGDEIQGCGNHSGNFSPYTPDRRDPGGRSGANDEITPERAAVAELFDLSDLSRLALTFSLHRLGQGRLCLKGRLSAKLTQTASFPWSLCPKGSMSPSKSRFGRCRSPRHGTGCRRRPATENILDWPEPIIDGKIDPAGALRGSGHRAGPLSARERCRLRLDRSGGGSRRPPRSDLLHAETSAAHEISHSAKNCQGCLALRQKAVVLDANFRLFEGPL